MAVSFVLVEAEAMDVMACEVGQPEAGVRLH
jgi:hypothetical protein